MLKVILALTRMTQPFSIYKGVFNSIILHRLALYSASNTLPLPRNYGARCGRSKLFTPEGCGLLPSRTLWRIHSRDPREARLCWWGTSLQENGRIPSLSAGRLRHLGARAHGTKDLAQRGSPVGRKRMTGSKYKIVKGAALSPPPSNHAPKFPFRELEVGDCFFVPLTDISEGAARVQCSRWSLKLDRRFRVRQFDNQFAQFWRES